MRHAQEICLVLALGLLVLAILGLVLTGDRVAAALFDLWKFSGYKREHGIDLGANSSFRFLSLCAMAAAACMPLALLAKRWNNKLLYRLATSAGAVYCANGALMFFLVSSGLAFLYCGR
jgi:hypothetical protein